MRRQRWGIGRRLGFEELESRSLLSASFFSASSGFSAGAGGLAAAGTGNFFGAGTSGTPIGAEFGDVSAGGFGATQGFGAGFGVPGASDEAGASGFGTVGSGGFGTLGAFPGGIAAGPVPGNPGIIGQLDRIETTMAASAFVAATGAEAPPSGASEPSMDSAVGQLTVTTGAGTLGIRSFATPTAGFSEGAGGAGGPVGGAAAEEEPETQGQPAPTRAPVTPDADEGSLRTLRFDPAQHDAPPELTGL